MESNGGESAQTWGKTCCQCTILVNLNLDAFVQHLSMWMLRWSRGTSFVLHNSCARHLHPNQPLPRLSRGFTAAALQEQDAAADDQPVQRTCMVPLRERPPSHSATWKEIWGFYKEANRIIDNVADLLQTIDQGPDRRELRRELEWFLEDAIAGVDQWEETEKSINRTGGGLDLAGASWPRILRNSRRIEDAQLQLRAPLDVLEALWQQRVGLRRPLQYLVNATFWRDLVLAVGPGVLIPRPETEEIVDIVQKAMRVATPEFAEGVWADVGTGSGALALGLAHTFPNIQHVYATDISADALEWAKFNVHRLGMQQRVTCLHGHLLTPLAGLGLQGQLAGIVSNPPYIPKANIATLQAEVGNHEPHLALDGGPGAGMRVLLPIYQSALEYLMHDGMLVLETNGQEQAEALQSHMQGYQRSVTLASGKSVTARYASVEVVHDLFCVPRFVVARAAHG